jgi:uncharacterized protein YebE (UPF0316 family)
MVLGFFEVLIWLFSVSTVIIHIRESLWTVVAYAGGFATGNLVGMLIEEKLAIGSQIVRIINPKGAEKNLVQYLHDQGLNAIRLEGEDRTGPVELCFLAARRSQIPRILHLVEQDFPESFLTIEDIRSTGSISMIYRNRRSRLPLWKKLIKYT